MSELNRWVPDGADSLDGDEVTRQRAAMAQRVKRGNPGTHQRRGLGRVERFRHPRQRFHRRHHIFLIATVVADAANLPVHAVHKVPATAGKTSAVLPAVPADSNPLAFLPFLHARAHLVDHAGHFVSWDTRIGNAGEKAILGNNVAVTDSTSLDADPYVPRSWLRNFSLHAFKVCSGLRHLHGFHFRHCFSPFTSDFPALGSVLEKNQIIT